MAGTPRKSLSSGLVGVSSTGGAFFVCGLGPFPNPTIERYTSCYMKSILLPKLFLIALCESDYIISEWRQTPFVSILFE